MFRDISAARICWIALVSSVLVAGCDGDGGSLDAAQQVTGLVFPGNAAIRDGETVRFQFDDPLPPYPATYIWEIVPRPQAGYYTTFFWGNNGSFDRADVYYGFHPYPDPPPNGVAHRWEIAVAGTDILSPEDVAYDLWYTQVARVYEQGGNRVLEFYWDWPDIRSRVIIESVPASEQPNMPVSPVLTFGDAPWAPGKEMLSGILRGIQVYDDLLSLSEVAAELASPGSVRMPWYLNLNPTPDDILDRSGNDHHPQWVGPLRPTLYAP